MTEIRRIELEGVEVQLYRDDDAHITVQIDTCGSSLEAVGPRRLVVFLNDGELYGSADCYIEQGEEEE